MQVEIAFPANWPPKHSEIPAIVKDLAFIIERFFKGSQVHGGKAIVKSERSGINWLGNKPLQERYNRRYLHFWRSLCGLIGILIL
jgi:hypothetical protein